MNNKYQEALDNLVHCKSETKCKECKHKERCTMERDSNILQELIDKATPKKPIGAYTDYKCPVCSRRVRSGKGSSSHQRDNVCQRCYQILDWSDEDA